MKTYPVKFYNESMQGAGQTGDSDAGTMIAILKACLVDGFGSLAPDSIVWDETELLAKASFSGGHAYEKDSVIACSGSAVTDYNGEHRIIKVTSTEIWFELDTVPVAPASGSLEIKIAPLGWEITHSNGTNDILVFSPAGNLGEVSLRIDNTAFSGWSGTYARLMKVAMVENVTDIDTYETIYEHCWPATGRYSDHKWDLVGDNRFIFSMPEYGAGKEQACFVAGYIDTLRAGDKYHFIMNHVPVSSASDGTYARWDQVNSAYPYYNYFASNNVASQNYVARRYHQLDAGDSWKKRGMGSRGSDLFNYPDSATNGFYLNTSPTIVQESDNTLRGYMPILVEPLANATSLERKNLQDLPEHPNKIFRFLRATYDRRSDLSATLIGFDISTVEV
ncbi:hypothetical protein CW745_13865 [Psychromonas sp. psych-6C06]|uniref:hypothetical protein n=1 Tax=Psychromonas sp. psych-6C06 TaxID=2058089 RepID=UPI000C33E6B1|nr:hypothetical protein [Psychromonas sp. psych-6C06]PKF60613.1 hypothetical protein CW745_13865 [Psychromonas sp. psych-6C06]